MTNTSTTTPQSRVDHLWAHVETHCALTVTPHDWQALHDLDVAALEGTLTEARLKRTEARLKAIPRSYTVEGDGTDVDPAYWSAIDKDGKTNLQLRRVIHKAGRKLRRKKGLWVIKINGVEQTFRLKAEAELANDIAIERARTTNPLTKNLARDLTREADRIAILSECRVRSVSRKEAIREAMKPDPVTGIRPTMSEVLRRPEFDQSGEPYQAPQKATPRLAEMA